jgi:hypothetical protein
MSALNSIPPAKLFRLVGIPQAPVIIDVQTDEDFALNPRLIPGSLRRSHENVADWSPEFRGRSAVVVCQKGLKLSVARPVPDVRRRPRAMGDRDAGL